MSKTPYYHEVRLVDHSYLDKNGERVERYSWHWSTWPCTEPKWQPVSCGCEICQKKIREAQR